MSPRRDRQRMVPAAELQKFTGSVEAALAVFRARAETLRLEQFEPVGAETVEATADDLAELLDVIRGPESFPKLGPGDGGKNSENP